MGIMVAVDIGGTQIRSASYSNNSLKPISHRRIATQSPVASVFDRLTKLVVSIWPKDETVDAISVATAGALDPETGIILAAPNIPGWQNFPLKAELEKKFHVPAFIGNDANLAALGEWRFGAGLGYHDLIYLTISTGIGSGVISADRLLLGKQGLAAELGHVTILPGGPLCSCGQHGHLESIASGPAIVRDVNEKLADGEQSILLLSPGLSARTVAEAAKKGDTLAMAAFARAGGYLGSALAGFLHIFNPAIVIFGGGVSLAGPLLFDPMLESLRSHIFDPSYTKDLVIVPATLGDDAGLLGAMAYAHMKLQVS